MTKFRFGATLKFAALMVAVFLLFFVPGSLFLGHFEGAGDDAAYLSHAFTLGLDGDFDYSNEIVILPSRGVGADSKPCKIPSHPIGSGIMAAPFVAGFSILDRLCHHPVLFNHREYHGSWSLFGFLFAVNFYFLAGIYLYLKSVRLICPGVSSLWLFFVLFSTGIPFYVLCRFSMSHGFEFFGLALLLWASLRWRVGVAGGLVARPRWSRLAWVAGAFNGVLWIRPSDFWVVLIPYIMLLIYEEDSRVVMVDAVLLALVAVLSYIPLAIFNDHFFGSIVPKMGAVYPGLSGLSNASFFSMLWMVFRRLGDLLKIGFSSEFGLLYSNPVLLLGTVAGLVISVRRALSLQGRGLLLLLLHLVYFGSFFGIVIIWQTTASGYGYRYLFPLLPLAVYYFVQLLSWVKNWTSYPWWHGIVHAGFGLLLFWSMVNMGYFWSIPELGVRPQVNVFGRFHDYSANGYELALFRNVVRPDTTLMALGKSAYGMLAYQMIAGNLGERLIPAELRPLARQKLGAAQAVQFMQMLVLAGLWLAAGVCYARHDKTGLGPVGLD